MSLRPLSVLFVSVLVGGAIPLVAACTSLTSPPDPEAIASAQPQAAAGSAGAVPTMKANAALASAMAAPTAAPGPEGKLEVVESAAGKGTPAKNGDTVNVNYVGKLTNGQIFDQSKGTPFSFQLGAGRVIKGWDQGLLGMKPGSKRTLTIPPSLAYGPRGMPPVIPPSSTLVFDVEMVSITPGK